MEILFWLDMTGTEKCFTKSHNGTWLLWLLVSLKALYKLRKEMRGHFRENIKLTTKLFVTLIFPILLYGSETWGIDCNGKMNKDPAELVQDKFLKWLRVLIIYNKYCNNNACRVETRI